MFLPVASTEVEWQTKNCFFFLYLLLYTRNFYFYQRLLCNFLCWSRIFSLCIGGNVCVRHSSCRFGLFKVFFQLIRQAQKHVNTNIYFLFIIIALRFQPLLDIAYIISDVVNRPTSISSLYNSYEQLTSVFTFRFFISVQIKK